MRHFVALLLLASCLAAQRQTLTVGGTGANYQSLPVAVAAAQPGALILVRSGSHLGFSTNKPLTILEPERPAWRRLFNCAGTVVVEGINAAGNGPAIEVTNCARVVLQNCLDSGSPSAQVTDSTFAAVQGQFSSAAGAGVQALRSKVDLFRVSCSGFQAPAVDLSACTSRLIGDGVTLLQVRGAPLQPVSAIQTTGGTLTFDPAQFILQSLGTSQHLQNSGTAVVAIDLPILVASGTAPGGFAQVVLTRQQTAAGFVVLGFFGAVQVLPGIGDVWLDLTGTTVQGLALDGLRTLPSNPAPWVLL